ncbi:DUF6757 family protein [Halonotius pteroides]|jgi:hypothetical protein|uniref:DUF6757 family protein n=1 Tax=Halonotius pteroides TaxID=268735 RepID=UPI00140332A2|nr:DUF6757 family protein [Halonotius pteroides]
MRCHYCEEAAAFAAEKDGLKVGLCTEHFQERMEELTDSAELAELEEQLDVNRTE